MFIQYTAGENKPGDGDVYTACKFSEDLVLTKDTVTIQSSVLVNCTLRGKYITLRGCQFRGTVTIECEIATLGNCNGGSVDFSHRCVVDSPCNFLTLTADTVEAKCGVGKSVVVRSKLTYADCRIVKNVISPSYDGTITVVDGHMDLLNVDCQDSKFRHTRISKCKLVRCVLSNCRVEYSESYNTSVDGCVLGDCRLYSNTSAAASKFNQCELDIVNDMQSVYSSCVVHSRDQQEPPYVLILGLITLGIGIFVKLASM